MTKILIVDDDPDIRNAYSFICQKHGWEYDIAIDGVDAIEKLKQYKPDMILLDVLMPRMSGIDFLKQVKKLSIPLPATVVMTNSQVPKDTGELVLRLGAKSYSVKAHTDPNDLVELIKLHTGNQK